MRKKPKNLPEIVNFKIGGSQVFLPKEWFDELKTRFYERPILKKVPKVSNNDGSIPMCVKEWVRSAKIG